MAHNFSIFHEHNTKYFHINDKERISFWIKILVLGGVGLFLCFMESQKNDESFPKEEFLFGKREVQISLLVFMNAGLNKLLYEVLYILFQETMQ